MAAWNGFDFFIFLILTMNTILGMSRGASKEIVSTICLSTALIICIKYTIPLANFLNSSPTVTDALNVDLFQNFMKAIGAGPLTAGLLYQIAYSLSLLICFVGTFSVCEAGLSVTGFSESFSFPYAAVSRKVGGALGFTRGYIISLIFISIIAFHLLKDGSAFISGSFFVRTFASQALKLDALISAQEPENYQQLYQNKPYNEQDLYKNFPQQPTKPVQPNQMQQQ